MNQTGFRRIEIKPRCGRADSHGLAVCRSAEPTGGPSGRTGADATAALLQLESVIPPQAFMQNLKRITSRQLPLARQLGISDACGEVDAIILLK